jgi:hypothetical protein
MDERGVVAILIMLALTICLSGCTVTITADLPSKQIQNWFTNKK